MNDARKKDIEGIATAIEMLSWIDKSEAPMAELIVFYADEDDPITLEEAQEYLDSLECEETEDSDEPEVSTATPESNPESKKVA